MILRAPEFSAADFISFWLVSLRVVLVQLSCRGASYRAVAEACRLQTWPYFVANGGGFIFSTQLTSRFFASPLSRNSIAIRSMHPGSARPSTPCPASGTITCLLFGKCLATSSPYFGGVIGSMLPEKISTGAVERTGSRKLLGISPRGHMLQARLCWNTR